MEASNAYGAGLYLAAGTLTLSNDTVAGNSATAPLINIVSAQAEGGGIYIASKATATLCNDTVQSNSALVIGAGVFLSGGGGIYIVSGATVYIDAFTVAHTINNADNSGLNGPTANIDGTYILRNC